MFQLQDVSRSKVKIKLGINSPSGAGKTMGALLLAKGICGDYQKIALIDTENESASLYDHLGNFKTIPFGPPFSPERYIQAIKVAEANANIEVIILDSGTHEWAGSGGCLESNDTLAAARYKGNSWSAWNETKPRHQKFVDTVLQSRCHVIICNRSKTETVMGDDKKVKKLGMKEIQSEGFEYELSLSFNLDRDTHTATASKDRTGLFEGRQPFIITEETGKEIKRWCELGKELKAAPAQTTPAAEPEKKELLTKTHANWLSVVAAVKGSYTIENVQIKYDIDPDALKSLEEIIAAKNAPAPADHAPIPVTQQNISDGLKAEATTPKKKPF